MAAAKQSKLNQLHVAFTNVLADILNANGADTPAAALSVIRGFLSDSGIKPVSDSPAHQRLARAYEALPFTATDDSPAKPN